MELSHYSHRLRKVLGAALVDVAPTNNEEFGQLLYGLADTISSLIASSAKHLPAGEERVKRMVGLQTGIMLRLYDGVDGRIKAEA